jgi:hypothetical protein
VVVPTPSDVISTMRARHTCFCRLFRSATIACKRARSALFTSTVIPSRMPGPHHPSSRVYISQDSFVRFYPLAWSSWSSAGRRCCAASLLRGVPGVPALLLPKLPVARAVPPFDRAWIATVLTLQTVGGAILGIAAQAQQLTSERQSQRLCTSASDLSLFSKACCSQISNVAYLQMISA